MAISLVSFTSERRANQRGTRPITSPMQMRTTAITAKRPNLIGGAGGRLAGLELAGSGVEVTGGMAFIKSSSRRWIRYGQRCRSGSRIIRPATSRSMSVHKAEDNGNEQKRRDRGHEKASDNSTAQRSILFTAFAKAKAHRQHSNQHGSRSHQDGSNAAGPSVECRR